MLQAQNYLNHSLLSSNPPLLSISAPRTSHPDFLSPAFFAFVFFSLVIMHGTKMCLLEQWVIATTAWRPFRFLALPPEIRIMVYEHLTEILPISRTCHQTRDEYTHAMLPKLHLRLHCGTSGDAENKPWHISISRGRNSSSRIEEKNLMLWDDFRSSHLAASMDMFDRITIRTAWAKSGSATIYSMTTRSRDGGLVAKLYKGEAVIEMEQGLCTELQVLEREERVIRDQSGLEVKRAEVLGKLAKRFCEMINLEDVRGEKCLEVWLSTLR